MTTPRQRLTWDGEAPRNASAHPATPDEGPASPAYGGPDPEANKYENGDTSSWAEDVHPGPYPNSAHPATPDEGPASPAYKAAALNKKADRCITIATAMLGSDAPYNVIEDQALTLMDMPSSSILASLKRLGEDVEEDAEDEEGSKKDKKASAKISYLESRLARIERILIRLADDDDDDDDDEDDDEEEGSKKAHSARLSRLERILIRLAEDEDDDEEEGSKKDKKSNAHLSEESQLEELLKEEGMWGMEEAQAELPMNEEAQLEELLMEEGMGEYSEDESQLEELLKEEGMGEYSEDESQLEELLDDEGMGEYADIDVELQGGMDDPMGVMDAEVDSGEMAILAQLYGPGGQPKAAGDDEEKSDDEEGKKTDKKASANKPRPKPRTASKGARSLGRVSKSASDEIASLSDLWEKAPDVSDHF